MDLKDQIIQEYLSSGCGYRKLASKYGVSRTTICKWVAIYQGIYNLESTKSQQTNYLSLMATKKKNKDAGASSNEAVLLQKIAALEKQLADQELKSFVLDTMINVAEKQLNINIRKKPGTQQSKK
jgi:transposase-like protein